MKPEPRIYAIADRDLLGPGRLFAAIEEMAEAGVGRIQVRAKAAPGGEIDDLLLRVGGSLEAAGIELWIDDRVDLAALHERAGVHLGQTDLSPSDARRLLGPGTRIGRSTHDLDQVAAAEADPAVDVVAFGPVFRTTSKSNPDPVVGLEKLRRARAATSKPLVAIGGIESSNLGSVLEAGADAAAMIGAVSRPPIGASCRELVRRAREVA